LSHGDRDFEQDEHQSPAEQPVNLPPPPFVPIGLPQDAEEREREAAEELEEELRRTG
jgi:hypothetical protein